MRKRLSEPEPRNPIVYIVMDKKTDRVITVWRKEITAKEYIKKFRLRNKTYIKSAHLFDVVDLQHIHRTASPGPRKRLREK